MQSSLVLVDGSFDQRINSSSGVATAGPAKGDRSLLPLGLIVKPSAAAGAGGGNKTTFTTAAAVDPARQQQQQPAAAAAAAGAGAGGCPSSLLPSPPEGHSPVMVLFPATLHLAIFFAPPPRATLVSAVMSLLAMLGSWVWGWGLLSTAGARSGLAAGFVAGLGVRWRPVGGWGYAALSALGIALLGGGLASLALGVSLALSTLWRNGWWLYLQPECAPVLFMLSGTTADVALGFLLGSLLQVHGTPPPPPPPQQQQQALPQPEIAAAHQAPVSQENMWNAVTPPGIAGSRGRRW